MFISVVIAVYNRPDELKELLQSLLNQEYKNFEVIVIDDGSSEKSLSVCEQFMSSINLQYFYTENQGQGFARNDGMKKASGDILVLTDSDCTLPKEYLKNVVYEFEHTDIDVYGGPDEADDSFSDIQKAVHFSMRSFLSTGGARGSKKSVTKYLPRSFNMGFRRRVFEKTKGFLLPQKAEDLDLSIRMYQAGFNIKYCPNIVAYHKRRTSLLAFFKQIYFFGQGRIALSRMHKGQFSVFHLLPILYTAYTAIALFVLPWATYPIFPLLVYVILLYLESYLKNSSVRVALLSIFTVQILHVAYASGMIKEYFRNNNYKKK